MQPQLKNNARPARRVLVVDDDIDTAQTLFFLLLDMGHDAAYATDGRGALEKARKLRPEFIFLDIGLPDLDGSQVAEQGKHRSRCETALFIPGNRLGDQHRGPML